MSDETGTAQRGVQAVGTAVAILRSLAAEPGPATLSEISERSGIPAAKVHRYLASFVISGMVVHRQNGIYDLGPVAAEVGLAAVARLDGVNRAADILPDIVRDTDCTGMLSVWGTRGPTVVRWERSRTPLVTTLGLGSVLPVLHSATGRAFLAHLPARLTEPFVSAEDPGQDPGDLDALKRSVRADGLALADQDYIPGLRALALPILDLQGDAEAVITLVSTDPRILQRSGSIQQRLRAVATAPFDNGRVFT